MGCASSTTANGTAIQENNLTKIDLASTELLTQNELQLIENSWNSVPNKEEFGISIMIRIFQAHKEVKNKWIFASNLETEAEMISNSQVRYHAKKIIDVFSKIIESLTSSGNIEQFDLVRLGASHFHYGVKREDFVHFEESLIFALKKHITDSKLFNQKVEKIWKKAFSLIVAKLSEGIEKEEIENNKNIIKINNNNSRNNSNYDITNGIGNGNARRESTNKANKLN